VISAELDACRGELGEIAAALHRGDHADARSHGRRLEAAVRRLRAKLERSTVSLAAILEAFNDADVS
jgi:hypothetical protein